MANDIMLGYLTGKIRFTLSQDEARKLNPTYWQKKMVPADVKLPAGVGSPGTDAMTGQLSGGDGDKKKQNKQFWKDTEQTPIGKGLLGFGKMLGPIGAALAFIASSGSLRELLGSFFDLIGMVSDLIFVALWPVIKPLLFSFVDAIKVLAEYTHKPGGILSAILMPEVWDQVALILLDGIVRAAGALLQIGVQILNGFMDGINDPTVLAKITVLTNKLMADIVSLFKSGTDLFVAMVSFLVNVFTSDAMMQAWVKIGMAIAQAFFEYFIKNPISNLVNFVNPTPGGGGFIDQIINAASGWNPFNTSSR